MLKEQPEDKRPFLEEDKVLIESEESTGRLSNKS